MSGSQSLKDQTMGSIHNLFEHHQRFMDKILEEQFWATQTGTIDSIEDKKQRIEHLENVLNECEKEYIAAKHSFEAHLNDLLDQYLLEEENSEAQEQQADAMLASWTEYYDQNKVAAVPPVVHEELAKALDLIHYYQAKVQQLEKKIDELKEVKAELISDIEKLSAEIESDYRTLSADMKPITIKLPHIEESDTKGIEVSVNFEAIQKRASSALLAESKTATLTAERREAIERKAAHEVIGESITRNAHEKYNNRSLNQREAYIQKAMSSEKMHDVVNAVGQRLRGVQKQNPGYEDALRKFAAVSVAQIKMAAINGELGMLEKIVEFTKKQLASQEQKVAALMRVGGKDVRSHSQRENDRDKLKLLLGSGVKISDVAMRHLSHSPVFDQPAPEVSVGIRRRSR